MTTEHTTDTSAAEPAEDGDGAQKQTAELAHAQDLLLLEPSKVRLFRTGGNAVRMTIEGMASLGADRSYIRVQIARAYPLSQQERYFGFRDGDDRDIGLMETLDGLEADSRRVMDEEMGRRYFLPVIRHVANSKDEFGSLFFDVETDKGRRTFYVRQLRDSVQRVPGTDRVLLTDTDGNRYDIPDVTKLDARTLGFLNQAL